MKERSEVINNKIPKTESKCEKVEKQRKIYSLQHREIESLKFQD